MGFRKRTLSDDLETSYATASRFQAAEGVSDEKERKGLTALSPGSEFEGDAPFEGA